MTENGTGIAGEKETHFGFRTVAEDEKAGLVRSVFDTVATRYDLMNDLMSAGLHRAWKASLIDSLKPRAGMHLLDVAGGTGDIATRFMTAVGPRAEGSGGPGAEGSGAQVTVVDINHQMLTVGRDRALDRGRMAGVSWVTGDAEALPLPDRSVDAYTIAFGIRNVTHIDQALDEAFRVLKFGGHLLVLEFSKLILPGLDALYDTYSFDVLPALGALVAKDGDSYRYLAESIRQFPDQEHFATMITEAGFQKVIWRNMSGGVVALHSGWRV